jgi:TMEM175 potassium channel family protein
MTEAEERAEAGRELDRIIFFSDADFAIVITILVLDIRVPDIPPDLVAQELPGQILDLGPKFLSYVISFLVIAIYWQAHHRVFRPIRSYDRTLLWLNFLFLMAISFLPFPTSLLGEYSEEQLSAVIYAANAALASLLLVSISWYASAGHRLVAPNLVDDETERNRRVQGLAVPVVFLVSIGISFFSPRAAMYSWLLLTVTDPLIRRVWSR